MPLNRHPPLNPSPRNPNNRTAFGRAQHPDRRQAVRRAKRHQRRQKPGSGPLVHWPQYARKAGEAEVCCRKPQWVSFRGDDDTSSWSGIRWRIWNSGIFSAARNAGHSSAARNAGHSRSRQQMRKHQIPNWGQGGRRSMVTAARIGRCRLFRVSRRQMLGRPSSTKFRTQAGRTLIGAPRRQLVVIGGFVVKLQFG